MSVITLSSTQLRVNWTAPLNALITEHVIYLDGAEFGRSQGSEFIISGLRPYTEYSVGVSASNEAGEGSVSQGQSARTLEDCECVWVWAWVCVCVCVWAGVVCVCVCIWIVVSLLAFIDPQCPGVWSVPLAG